MLWVIEGCLQNNVLWLPVYLKTYQKPTVSNGKGFLASFNLECSATTLEFIVGYHCEFNISVGVSHQSCFYATF